MSSHHIVRDEQEPALFLFEPEEVDYQVIENLLEWSPLVIVPDYHLELVLTWGIKFDSVIYEKIDLNSLKIQLIDYQPVTFISAQRNYLQSGLKYLTQNGHFYLNLLANFNQIKLQLSDILDLEVIVYQADSKFFQIKNGFWKKWLTQGTRLSIEAKGFEAKNIIQNEKSYLVENDGWVEINNFGQSFWVGEQIQ